MMVSGWTSSKSKFGLRQLLSGGIIFSNKRFFFLKREHAEKMDGYISSDEGQPTKLCSKSNCTICM